MVKLVSKKVLSLAMVSILITGALSGCGKANTESSPSPGASGNAPTSAVSGTVTASGSTALQPLVAQAATEFQGKNKNVTVNVTGGGSGTGVKNVADGVSNIGNSDVEAAAEYKDALVDHIVCIAPFALIVNASVNVDNITKQQAADIFSGKITNWKDVGGADKKIVLVHRQDSSGSRKLVKKIVMGDQEFSKDGVTQESSKTVATAVEGTDGAIGYVDTPYVKGDKMKALKIDGVAYSKDAIKDGKYPLYGVEHMYTKGEATGATKEFIDYIMSADFQSSQVEKLGFLPADTVKK